EVQRGRGIRPAGLDNITASHVETDAAGFHSKSGRRRLAISLLRTARSLSREAHDGQRSYRSCSTCSRRYDRVRWFYFVAVNPFTSTRTRTRARARTVTRPGAVTPTVGVHDHQYSVGGTNTRVGRLCSQP